MKKAFIGTLVLALCFIAVGTVFATESNFCPIAQRIAERFNLSESEVQEVFTEAREERRQEMEVRFEERLNELVNAGEITEEQKGLVLAKKVEMQEKREELKDLSWEERKEALKELRQEMREWTEENGIDLRGFGGEYRGFGKGRGFRLGGFGSKAEI